VTKESAVNELFVGGDASRHAPLAMDAATFRKLGHRLVDQLAGFLESLPSGPVTRDEPPSVVREALDLTGPLPQMGTEPGLLLEGTARLLFGHSLFNGHPRFFGYITAPPAPIGILGDFLAAALNPNVGAWTLSPAATEMECQTVRWIAELIGYPVNCGGLLVSGGNMANFVCFLAARAAKAGWDVRRQGVSETSGRRLRVYCSGETHTWIQKAADLSGLGTESIRWITADSKLRMDTLASRYRDRVPDREMDRRAHWLSSQLRWTARQRRQYGELRLLLSRTRCQGGLGCPQARRFRKFGTQASCVLFG